MSDAGIRLGGCYIVEEVEGKRDVRVFHYANRNTEKAQKAAWQQAAKWEAQGRKVSIAYEERTLIYSTERGMI